MLIWEKKKNDENKTMLLSIMLLFLMFCIQIFFATTFINFLEKEEKKNIKESVSFEP